ncbi:MAG: hypothetical protein PUF65_09100 [Lachnospiraceae bacterium]|nr:hypothetical protein [Lachnospiraceae bacterium]
MSATNINLHKMKNGKPPETAWFQAFPVSVMVGTKIGFVVPTNLIMPLKARELHRKAP